jgi:hypothetical protein
VTIINTDDVRSVEVYDDYTEPHCELLKHVRLIRRDGSIIDMVAIMVDGNPDDAVMFT